MKNKGSWKKVDSIELQGYPTWYLIQARKTSHNTEALTLDRYETFYGSFEEAKTYSELYSRSHSTKVFAIVKDLEQLDTLKKIRYYQREYSRIMGELTKQLKKENKEQWRFEILEDKKVFYQKRVKELNRKLSSGREFFIFKEYLSKTSFKKIKLKRENN